MTRRRLSVPLHRKLVIDLVLHLGISELVQSTLVATRLIVPLSHMLADCTGVPAGPERYRYMKRAVVSLLDYLMTNPRTAARIAPSTPSTFRECPNVLSTTAITWRSRIGPESAIGTRYPI